MSSNLHINHVMLCDLCCSYSSIQSYKEGKSRCIWILSYEGILFSQVLTTRFMMIIVYVQNQRIEQIIYTHSTNIGLLISLVYVWIGTVDILLLYKHQSPLASWATNLSFK